MGSAYSCKYVVDKLQDAELIACDTETTGLSVKDGVDFGLGISIAGLYKKDIIYSYFPFRHKRNGEPDPDNLPNSQLEDIKQLLENKPVVFFNAKFDLVVLKGFDINVDEFYDTMLMAHLINENKPKLKSLDNCCLEYLGYFGKEKSPEFEIYLKMMGWANMPANVMGDYAAADAKITYQLFKALEKKIDYE